MSSYYYKKNTIFESITCQVLTQPWSHVNPRMTQPGMALALLYGQGHWDIRLCRWPMELWRPHFQLLTLSTTPHCPICPRSWLATCEWHEQNDTDLGIHNNWTLWAKIKNKSYLLHFLSKSHIPLMSTTKQHVQISEWQYLKVILNFLLKHRYMQKMHTKTQLS